MDDFSISSDSGAEAAATFQQLGAPANTGVQRPDRPCDICRKRKSRCVKEPGQEKCVLCTFHHRECTYLDEPAKRKRKRSNDGGNSVWSAGAGSGPRSLSYGDEHLTTARYHAISSPDSQATSIPNVTGKSLLDKTLGLHRITHSTHIGSSSIHEPLLFNFLPGTHNNSPQSKYRHVDYSTTFLRRQDRATLFASDDDDDLSTIEAIVRPHGLALVALYFRIVHPSYPILHKGVFLEKYARSYREFSPPLLAAVYLLAMDWWDYDRDLGPLSSRPDCKALIRAATKTLTSVIHRPKLSTLQAGLLLLQRSGGDSWPLTSQIVAVAEELGLHLDCSAWGIPDWEKGLRRRLSWAIFMQDKWGAMVHGRPSHVVSSTWQLRQLSLSDFPESAADESDKDGSTEVETGRQLFIHLSQLTTILAAALDTLYQVDGARVQQALAAKGVPGLLDLVKPVAVELKAWAAGLPPELGMDYVKTRKLCSNGYLHLSYYAAEIIVHRAVIRALPSDTPPQLRTLCREAAASRLDHAMAFVESLRPEHLEGFWWFASSHCLALIGSFAALLWATGVGEEEAGKIRQKLEDFRWSLKVRAKGSPLLMAAIQEIDHVLDGVDFDIVPNITAGDIDELNDMRQPTPTGKGALGLGTVETADEISHHQYAGDLVFDDTLGAEMMFASVSPFGAIGAVQGFHT